MTMNFCITSDCSGIDDTASCVGAINGGDGTCGAYINNTFRCEPAGTAAVGDDCERLGADPAMVCTAGLQCVGGSCVTPCDADNDCDAAGGETCIGEADGILAQGFGLCGAGCTPYSGADGNCAAGSGCFPITATEGICDSGTFGGPVGTAGDFEFCNTDLDAVDPAEQCGPNSRCIGFQTADAGAGIPGVGRCTPYCDSSAASQAAADATCESANSFCLDLSGGGAPSSSSGICLENCDVAAYSQNTCSGTDNSCIPFRGVSHACFPGTDPAVAAAVGAACDPDDITASCVEEAVCEPQGDGTGLCRSRCHIDAADPNNNAALVCAGNEICNGIGAAAYNFGSCGIECTPTDYVDTTCPANLQTCIPSSSTDPSVVCSASGAIAVGAECDAATCVAGAQCGSELSVTLHDDGMDTVPVCFESCELFAAVTTCPQGSNCVPNFGAPSDSVGVCLTNSGDKMDGEACDQPGTACGPAAWCSNVQDSAPNGPVCFAFCSVSAPNCNAGMTCRSVGGDLGVCR